MVIGNIFDIQRFCVHDGPGIRTTVFVKGCPLRCIWCHNPESQKKTVSIAYYADKCVECGSCVGGCEKGARRFERTRNGENIETNEKDQLTLSPHGVVSYDRAACLACSSCVQLCPTGALESLGRKVTVSEVMGEVERDKTFYKNSGGGLTVSGGEPLAQAEFLTELLKAAKEAELHVCIETCGFAPKETLKEIAKYVDIFLYDIKETDDTRHKALTGVPFAPILENLKLLDSMGKATVLRCPLVPEKNLRDEHLQALASLAASLKCVSEINVMAYHRLGSAKYTALDMADEMKDVPAMTQEQKTECIEKLKGFLEDLGRTDIKVK